MHTLLFLALPLLATSRYLPFSPPLSISTLFSSSPSPVDFTPATTSFISRLKIHEQQQAQSLQKLAGGNNRLQGTVGGVSLCSGRNFTGECWTGNWGLAKCVGLNDFAGHVLSFQPDAGTECYLMQGQCNSANNYADLYRNSTDVADLSGYGWIEDAASYICFTPL